MTLDKLYKKLLEKHPDDLIDVSVKRLPGILNKIPPFYHVTISINGILTYSIPSSCLYAHSPEEAIEQTYSGLDK